MPTETTDDGSIYELAWSSKTREERLVSLRATEQRLVEAIQAPDFPGKRQKGMLLNLEQTREEIRELESEK